MHEYAFYLEYAGRKVRQKYISPDAKVRAKNISVAVKRFGAHKKMQFSGWEKLNGSGYRVFYIYRRKEYVYYVSQYPERT